MRNEAGCKAAVQRGGSASGSGSGLAGRALAALTAALLTCAVGGAPALAQDGVTRLTRDQLLRNLDVLRPVPISPGVVPPALGSMQTREPLRELLVENAAIRSRAALTPRGTLAASLRRAAATGPAPVATLIELDRQPSADERQALAAQGIRLEGLVGGSTYLASVTPDATAEPALAGIVAAGRVLAPADKLRANLRLSTPALPSTLPAPGAPDSFLLRAASGAAEALRAGGAEEVEEVLPGRFLVRAPREALEGLAEIPQVLSIDVGPPQFLPLTFRVRRLVGVEPPGMTINEAAPLGAGGAGVRVAIFDTAVDEAHHDFCGEPNETAARFFRRDSDADVCSDFVNPITGEIFGDPHGTHVAGIVAGNGRMSTRFWEVLGIPDRELSFRGIAPRTALGEFVQQREQEVRLGLFAEALVASDADVSNHSYVESLVPYGEMAAFIDTVIAGRGEALDPDDPTRLVPISAQPQVWAAGNNGQPPADPAYGQRAGYLSVLTQAKNAISVGSIDTKTGQLSVFSSLGPTFDGRIKPDLVAPGCHDSTLPPQQGGVWAAQAGGQGYIADCGTSMAAPVVTGIVALMRAEASATEILPSTYKAILVATARDLAQQPGLETWPENPDTEGLRTFYGSGPDWATGFGLVDAGAAVAAVANGHWREGEIATEAPRATACFEVSEGVAALGVALAWDDPAPASTDFGHAMLVNDLDLTLTGPDGVPHLPWVLHPPDFGDDIDALIGPGSNDLEPDQLLPAERGRDRLNNVELVEVNQPAPGVWRASVEAAALGDGPQRFSLAGQNVIRDCDG